MIFVTVGTHEQPFNRLIKEIDRLIEANIITEEVVLQSGFSTYSSKYCKVYKFLTMEEMNSYMKKAKIIITHGGPASFIAALQKNKIPIVVPRQKIFGEHINDHQVSFVKFISKKMDNIIPIYDINNLEYVISNYQKMLNLII